jgi:hypothetical protein
MHPLAALFPKFAGTELRELIEDIRTNGLQFPITVYQGQILDGRNRYYGCLLAEVEPRFEQSPGTIHLVLLYLPKRRHLSQEQRRELIAQLLKENSNQPDREVGKITHTYHSTVGAERKRLDSVGEISQQTETIGADGKTHQWPSRQPSPNETMMGRLPMN